MDKNVKYEKNYLNSVICRIDFINQISDSTIESVLSSEDIVKAFPIKAKDQIKEDTNVAVIDKNGGIPEVSKSTEKFIIKTLVDETGKNRMIISKKHFILEYSDYNSFEETKAHFDYVARIIISQNSEIKISRFGLRYINVFNSDICKINKNYFSDTIKNLVKIESFPGMKVSRALGNMEYVCDDMRLKMKCGEFNRNYPGIIEKHDFVLDYDAFVAGIYSLSEISQQKIALAHEMIQNAFEGSITDSLRNLMKG